MKHYKIINILLLSITLNIAFAQKSDLRKTTYRAYLTGSATIWKQAIVEASKISGDDANYLLAQTQYGLLSNTMATQDKDTFDQYESETSQLLEDLIENDNHAGEASALLSSILGFKMGYSPWKGMFLGSKSTNLIEFAAKKAPQSALVWKIYGSSKLYTPKSFGGDPNEAIVYFTKSIALYEQQNDTANNWLYLDAHAFLGMAYEKVGKTKEAVATYEKALIIAPDYKWVTYSLLPAAKKRL